MEEYNNEIEQIVKEEEEIVNAEIEEVTSEHEEYKKIKKNKRNWFKKMSKNQKIIFISAIIFVTLVIAGVILYFVVFKDDEDKKTDETPDIILEMNNYRYENGTLVFLDKSDKELGTYECENQDETKCLIGYYNQDEVLNNSKYYDEDGNLMEFSIPTYEDNFVFIYDFENDEDKKLLLYDIKNEEILGEYKTAKKYGDSALILQNEEDLFGIISFDETGKVDLVPFEYSYLGSLDGKENISYEKDGKYGLLKNDGTSAVSDISDQIVSYNDENLIVLKATNYYIINYTKERVLDGSFDYANITGNYAEYVSDSKLFIVNHIGNKLNEIGYELSSEKYIKEAVLDKSYKTLSSEESYKIVLDGEGLLKITIDNKEESINTYEANINSKYEYINYIDGIIYIYQDADKTEVIGSYECENENNVTEETTEFTTCFIAKESKLLNRTNSKDTLGYIPIYNNKYVFINDASSSSANDNIILYNLEDNKDVATYIKVDVGYYNSEDQIISATTSNLLIMAQNSKKLYGIVNMTSSDVKGFIPFEYTSIEILNNGYLAKNSDGEYKIYDSAGKELTGSSTSIKNEVIDFVDGYIKVKSSDGKYLVYSMNGSIISNPATEIMLGDNVFLAADGKTLGVYKYTSGKVNILSKEVTVTTDDFNFVDNGSAGFKIELIDANKKVVQTYSFDSNGDLL